MTAQSENDLSASSELGNPLHMSPRSGIDPSKATSSRNWLPKLIVFFFLGVFVISTYFSSTYVSGVEFNPVTWQVRHFSFRADPFTDFQWTGIHYNSKFRQTDASITKLLDPQVAETPNRWEPAFIERATSSQTGPSMAMVQLLTGYGLKRGLEAVEYWKKWTTDHPAKAKEFWPAIHRLIINGQYGALPPLLDLPQMDIDDQQFSAMLNNLLLHWEESEGQS